MAINNATIAAGSTISQTGGTTFTLTPDGVQIPNGAHYVDAAQADVRIRRNLSVRSFPATYKSGSWTNGRVEITLYHPKILADGTQKFPNIKIMLSIHPENTQAEIDALTNQGAQILFQAAFQQLWRSGSIG